MNRTISFDLDAFPWADEPTMVSMYMYLLHHATLDEQYYHERLLGRGQLAVSTRKLAAMVGISMQSVRTSLRKFEKLGYITKEANHKMTVITVSDFDTVVLTGKKESKQGIPCPVPSAGNQETSEEETVTNDDDDKKKAPVTPEKKAEKLPSVDTVEKRKHDFGTALIPYIGTTSGKYSKTMIRDFYNYWTQESDNGQNLRFETQSFTSIAYELKIWKLQHQSKKKSFTPPTIEEVRQYIHEKGYNVDADAWWNFYNSKGWFVGKNKMVSWKSAIVTWMRNGNTINYANNTGNYNSVQQGKQQRVSEAAEMVNRLLKEADEEMSNGQEDTFGYL